MFKKNKLFKTLKILTSFVFIFGIFCTAVCKANWEVIELSTGNVLKITNVKPGELYDEIKVVPSRARSENILVTGEMNDRDFNSLSLVARNCKVIDLSGVKAATMPDGVFCEKNNLETFVCPANLKTIKRNSFIMCQNLKTVIFPKSLESIGVGCFQFCRKLETPPPEGITLGVRAFHATLNDPWETMKEKIVVISNQTFKIAS